VKSFRIFAGVSTIFCLLASPTQAALVQLCGASVCYEYDNDASINTGIAFYGTPTLLAGSDTLEFTPTAFRVLASGVNGFDQEVAVFQFTRVWSDFEIGQIAVAESGDYQILGNGNAVNSNLRLQVVDKANDNGLSSFPEVASIIANFNATTPTGFTAVDWTLAAQVNPAALFADLATVVDLQIQNTLQAFTGASGGVAQIQKKLILTASTSAVPLPGAVWLLGQALLAVALVKHRRRAPRA
jgi:hypothetical protein